VLTSNYFSVTKLEASTSFNFVQSWILFGALIVLVCLYRLRAQTARSESHPAGGRPAGRKPSERFDALGL